MSDDARDDVENISTAEIAPLITEDGPPPLTPLADGGFVKLQRGQRFDAPARVLMAVAPGFLIGAFIIAFDISYVVANYSRTIASDLHQLENAVWIPLAGSMSDTACQPLYGYFSKLHGRAIPAIVASTLLALGLFLCWASETLWELTLARVVFGMGASGVPLIAIILLTDLVSPATVPLLRSILVIVQNSGFMLGSPLGSYLARATSWHMPFLFESIAAILGTAILFLGRHLSSKWRDQDKSFHSDILGSIINSRRVDFDVMGSVLILAAVTTPLVAINLGGNLLAWDHPLEITLLCATPVLFALFVYQEVFRAKAPLMALKLFKSLPMMQIYLCTALVVFARNQLDMHITFYAEVRSSPGSSFPNWVLTCQFLGISLGSFGSGWLISRSGRFKWLLVSSTALVFTLYLAMAIGVIGPENPRFAPALVAFGVSLGAADNCLVVGLLSTTAKQDRAMSYAFYELIVAFSADAAIAVSSALQRNWFIVGMQDTFGASDKTQELISMSLKSLDYVYDLPTEIREGVIACFTSALRNVFAVSCALLGMSAVIALSLRNVPCDHWSEDAADTSPGNRSAVVTECL